MIPEGTQSNQQFKLKELGIPYINSSRRGQQFVNVIVDIPKHISRKTRKALEELRGEIVN